MLRAEGLRCPLNEETGGPTQRAGALALTYSHLHPLCLGSASVSLANGEPPARRDETLAQGSSPVSKDLEPLPVLSSYPTSLATEVQEAPKPHS